MEAIKNYTEASYSFYNVVQSKTKIEDFIETIKTAKMPVPEKYAYQAFCYAVLAREASSMIQKGKYIMQYGEYMDKAIAIEKNCYPARLLRFMIEKKLENVQFVSHHTSDKEFLFSNINSINDDCLKYVTQKVLGND